MAQATTSTAEPPDCTVGEIARRAGVPVHRVEYHVRARGIEPVRTASRYRLFSADVANSIAAELAKPAAQGEAGQ